MLTDGTLQLSDDPKRKPSPEAEAELRKRFMDMIKVLHAQQGTSLAISILDEQATRDFVAEHSAILNEAVSTGITTVGMSELMRRRISESNYVFSGIKTFHELNEAFPLLTDENGDRKPFERFLNDVQNIDESYNRNYLRAEYNFVNASAEMAGRWEKIAADGDRYDLQYRTAGDDKVRPEHAQLDGITLPPSDHFWDECYPPNGWKCRCTVAQVRRGKYPSTDVGEAYKRGNEAFAKDKKGMFRFNPGKQQRAIPKYNPYTISDCTNCNKIKLASKLPANQLCEVCAMLSNDKDRWTTIETERGKVRISAAHGKNEKAENIRVATYFANKHGEKIDLLAKTERPGVKSADVYNKTHGYEQEYKRCSATATSIDNRLRDGAKQADQLVLTLPKDVDLEVLARALHDRVRRTSIQEVIVVIDGKDARFNRDRMVSADFIIAEEDLK